METQQAAVKPDFFGRLLLLPALLEPRLQAIGAAWWARVSQTDPRAGWRWLAQNWHKVAAWWLTVGLALTALFLVVALLSWQNPQAMLFKAMTWSGHVFAAGGQLASLGAIVVLLLSLPVVLPAALLSVVVVLVLGMALILFGPLLMVGAVAFGVLLIVATAKRGGSWLMNFVFLSLGEADQHATLVRTVRRALGLDGSSINVQGQARLLEGDELARHIATNKATDKGAPVFLGYANGKAFHYRTEKHVYLTASSRSGKGRDLIIPNLRIYPESVFVLDPKGENCKATADEREKKNNTIAAFDPYGLTGRPSARFNPLASLTGKDMVTRADYLAEALVVGPDDHWNESARGLLRAMALHVATAPEEQLDGGARDLPTLRHLLTGSLDVTLEEMKNSAVLDGLVARLAESILGIPDNERGSIISTARRSTKWLDNPQLAELFRAGEDCISFEDFRDRKKRLSVYVCLPADIFTTYPQVCRLLATFALDTMMKALTDRKRPVMFILDELAQLKHLPIVERAFTLGAGFGMQMWAVFQSVEQAKKLYPLDTLYGSSGIRCFFNIADPDSCEFASKCASGVLSPSDIRHLPVFEMLTLLDSANPLMIERLGARMTAKAA